MTKKVRYWDFKYESVSTAIVKALSKIVTMIKLLKIVDSVIRTTNLWKCKSGRVHVLSGPSSSIIRPSSLSRRLSNVSWDMFGPYLNIGPNSNLDGHYILKLQVILSRFCSVSHFSGLQNAALFVPCVHGTASIASSLTRVQKFSSVSAARCIVRFD